MKSAKSKLSILSSSLLSVMLFMSTGQAQEIEVVEVSAAQNQTKYGEIYEGLSINFPDAPKPISVSDTEIEGLYEVVYPGPQIVYTDKKGEHVFLGDIIKNNGLSLESITAMRLKDLSKINVDEFNTENAIKKVIGSGERVIYTFEDPNCPYCMRLNGELAKLEDVTIYTFMLPILTEKSLEVSKKIWCSEDRVAAWDNYMSGNGVKNEDVSCDFSPIMNNIQFAQGKGVSSTPTIYLDNGKVIQGFVEKDQIQLLLLQ